MTKARVCLVFTIFLLSCGQCADDDDTVCGNNEVLKANPSDCVSDCCPVGKNAPCPDLCPPGPCRCGLMSRRANGTCISTRDCPAYKCDENEVFDSCPVCSESCSNASPDGRRCRSKFRIGITVICQPQCRCKPYYWRNKNDKCVPYAECSRCQKVANAA